MMKKKFKTITESGKALVKEQVYTMGDNTLKDVRVLGFVSRNNRVYPRDIVQKNMHKYENAVVNIDHPDRDGPRKYEARFGRLTGVYMGEDGLYANLTYNPKHPLAESFKWWAQNDPSAIGLSHNANAKTKYSADGFETITDIDSITSVDIVSEPGTTNGLFEHYRQTLENNMSKDDDKKPDEKEEDLVRTLDKGQQIKMEKEDEDKDDKDDKKQEGSGMDMLKPEALGDYVTKMKSKFMEVVGDEDKVLKLIDMLDLNSKTEAKDDDEDKEDKKEESDGRCWDGYEPTPGKEPYSDGSCRKEGKDDKDEKKEESLRTSNDPTIRKLLEELDSYRVKAKRDEITNKAREKCNKSGLPTYAITECFLDTLINSNEDSWSRLLEDRKKVVFHTKAPISTGTVDSKLTVENLVKALTQE